MINTKEHLLAVLASAWDYTRRNWKLVAGVALSVLVGLNYSFKVVPPEEATAIIGLAASVGIGLHKPAELLKR